MAEPSTLRRVLGRIGWGVAIGLLVAVWRWPDRLLALRHPDLQVQAEAACDLAREACTATFPDGLTVRLEATPGGLPAATPLQWRVEAPAPAIATQLEITGVSMPMGVTLVPLQAASDGAWEGRAGLPACTAARMQWRAEVRVEDDEGPRLAAFTFWSERGADAAPLPPPLGWDGQQAPGHGALQLDTARGALSLEDLRGKAVLVYFGYTACPDICPTTLATVGAAFRLLDPEAQQRVAGLMISLDPERDGLERLDTYASHFHPAIRGGTASPEALQAMAADWGVSWRVVPLEGSGLGYALDHSTDAFLVGPDGRFIESIPHGTNPQVLAERLGVVLGGG